MGLIQRVQQKAANYLLKRAINLAYTAAGRGRRAMSWMAPSTGPTSGLTGDLGTLINRSRAALRNDPWAAAGIQKLVANIVGVGIKPKSTASDDQFRKDLQQLFLDWTDESDADGVLDFYGQQSLAARAMLEAGECFHTTTAPQTGRRVIRSSAGADSGSRVCPLGLQRPAAQWSYHSSRY